MIFETFISMSSEKSPPSLPPAPSAVAARLQQLAAVCLAPPAPLSDGGAADSSLGRRASCPIWATTHSW